MKKLLITTIFLLISTNCVFATPTYVRGNQNAGSGISTLTLTSTGAGDLLIACEEIYTAGNIPSTLSDSAGNTYTRIQNNTSTVQGFACYYKENATASGGTNTLSVTSDGTYGRYVVAEYSGVSTSSSLRTSGQNYNAAANSFTSNASAMTTVVGDLVIGFMFNYSAAITAGSGYTGETSPSQSLLEDKVATSTSENPNGTSTGSNAWLGIGAAFAPTAGAAPGNVKINKAVINQATIN
jgi:hypothetical protein